MAAAKGILIIDDDIDDRSILADALESLNPYVVIYFENNGIDGMQKLHQLFNGETRPTLIIVDLNMPMMTGCEFLMEVKKDERFSKIPVVIYSTSVSSIEKSACLEAGAHSYVTKPLSYNESIDVAQMFLELAGN